MLHDSYQLPLFREPQSQTFSAALLERVRLRADRFAEPPEKLDRKSFEYVARCVLQLFLLGHDYLTVPDIVSLADKYGLVSADPAEPGADGGGSKAQSLSRRIADIASVCAGIGLLEKCEATSRANIGSPPGTAGDLHICLRVGEVHEPNPVTPPVTDEQVDEEICADEGTKKKKKRRVLNLMAYYRWKAPSVRKLFSGCDGDLAD
jgi:hypothetical protein